MAQSSLCQGKGHEQTAENIFLAAKKAKKNPAGAGFFVSVISDVVLLR